MSYNARVRATQNRAGGLRGYDRGWLPGSSQASAIGIRSNLVKTVRTRTNTLVNRASAANIAGGTLTEPLPEDFGDGDILIDTRSLVVKTNQLSGIGRFRSQYNVDADGIKYARYYLPIYPENYFKEVIDGCSTCEKPRFDSVIQVPADIRREPWPLAWTWTQRTPMRNWRSITSSSDGTKLAAVVNGGNIWTSSDSGDTWTELVIVGSTKSWKSITSSSDGMKLAAVVYNGNIWIYDANSGLVLAGGGLPKNWVSITSSANGTKLAAVVEFGNIWISNDSGANWTQSSTPGTANKNWVSITSSSNGEKLAAVVEFGNIWISNDSGANWTQSSTPGTANKNWVSITSSSNGEKLAAAVLSGNIWTSNDSGTTWTERSVGSNENWLSITSSSDGTKLAAVAKGGKIWTSSDQGVHWTKDTSVGRHRSGLRSPRRTG